MPEVKMINQNKGLLHKLFNNTILTSCILTITLLPNQTSLAAYKPPRNQKPPSGYTDSSGVRGKCNAIENSKIVLLAPVTHVGQTTSAYPSFAWFVSKHQSIPIEFSIYEFDQNNQPTKQVFQEELPSSSGIMELSQRKQALKVGKRYVWQVEALCNPNRPSRNIVASAEIEVVQMPNSLKTALSKTSSRLQKANLYAEAGMWYDALKEALTSENNLELAILTLGLMEDLANLEKTADARYRNLTSKIL